jgi:hypothetical protein
MATQFEWLQLEKGKYPGKTLPQIVLSDPDYFFWALNIKDFFSGPLAEQAKEIAAKATRMKIPKPDPENWRIRYQFHYNGTFISFSIIPAENSTYNN